MTTEIAAADRVLNCIPSKNTENDWNIENAMAAGILEAPTIIPIAKDLREKWWDIGDQRDSGSCVGWGTGDAVCRWHFVKAGKIKQDQKLSVRYLWMASKEMDEFTTFPTTFIENDGTSLKAALDIARKYGVVTDAVLPFRVADSTGALILEKLWRAPATSVNPDKTFYAMASTLKIANYFNLGTDQNNWRIWLATKGPILTALQVDATWDNAAKTNGNLDVFQPKTIRGGHCVALVGYTKDRFIVRNSWGTGWGDKGFGYASLAYAKEQFKEAYGISV
jgi:hypothetical protein